MLDEHGAEYRYREYTKEPLTADEIRDVLTKLAVGPREVLRTRDKAYAAAGITDATSDDALVEAMAEHPTLLQRPIGVRGHRAAVGRPVDNLLALLD